MTVFIFASNALLHKGIFESFLFALTLAVGITPEVLPVIITITLSKGALRMAKEEVVIKRLVAVEDFGNIDTLCCDKTGTLTEGQVSLSDYANLFRFMTYFGLISTFFDLVLILGLILVIKAGTELFRTAWFIESVLSELVVTFAIRTRKPFFRSRPSRWLLIASVVAGIASVAITFLVIGHTLFEFVMIPVSILIFIGGILLVYFFTVELAKKHFFKKYEL